MPALQPGAEVRYCDSDGNDCRAQVARVVDADAGIVDLTVYNADGKIVCGVSGAKRAILPADRIKPGGWW